MKKKIICVVGPTATGKTKLGVELANKYNGEIISADSRQVYKRLDIGTEKDLGEYKDVKYHLIDICEPEERFTLFDWLKLAKKIINKIFSQGKLPIVVGGTGLYIQALTQGFKLEQIKNEKLKTKSFRRKELEKMSLEKLREIYAKRPTPNAQLDLYNPHRLIRAIERNQENLVPAKESPRFDSLQIAIKMPREELYKRIDKRVDQRFTKEDMLEEVARLISSGTNSEWLKSLGLEYRIISEYLLDNFKISDLKKVEYKNVKDTKEFVYMKEKLKNKSHAFARRQLTWFRRFSEIKWIKNKKEAFDLVDKFLGK